MATESPKTLIEAVRHFSDPKVCEDALIASRWPRGVECPTCGSHFAIDVAAQSAVR